MRLLKVELDRFASRRLVRWGVVAAVAAAVLLAVAAWFGSRPPTDAQIAQAHVYLQQQEDDWASNGPSMIQDCKDHPENYGSGTNCDTDLAPQLTVADFLPTRGTFALQGQGDVRALAQLAVVLAILLGAASVCAEIMSGALGTWLTFEPRRTRVYWSKVAAAGIGGAVVTTIVIGAGIVALWSSYALTGQAAMTGHQWTRLAEAGVRSVALGALLGSFGAGLGVIVKHTVAALGVVVAWLGLGDGAVLTMALHRPGWTSVLASQAWIQGTAPYSVEHCTVSGDGRMCELQEHLVTAAHAGPALLLTVVVVAAVGWLVVHRRDVA